MNERKDNAQKRILCDTVQFLEDYEWIFNFKVTHILQDNIVDRIPLEWFEYLRGLDIDTFDSVFLDMKCGNLMQQRITRIQTDQVRNTTKKIDYPIDSWQPSFFQRQTRLPD